jgi:hypothetical protein
MKRRLIPVTAVALAALVGLGPAAAATPQAGTKMTLSVWFERDGELWLSTRSVARTPAAATAAITRLFAGPNAAETGAGVGSAIPAGTHLRGISIAGGVATIDVGRRVAAPADRKSIRMRLAQLTYTATQFPTVDKVRLEVAGQVVTSIDSAPVPQPAARRDFVRLLPPILVTRPTIGARIPTTVTIAGTANVFEAALTVRVLNARGRLLAHINTTATCGNGCRGNYSVTFPYHVLRRQDGTVVLLDTGGAVPHPHIVRVPVKLSAG